MCRLQVRICRLGLMLIVLLAGRAGQALQPAAADKNVSSTLRQVWVISSRHSGRCDSHDAGLHYWRHDDLSGQWAPASHEEFVAADQPGVPTCVYVHGNRISHQEAVCNGWQAYQRIAGQCQADMPLRFVIWSWPSTEIQGQLKDVQYKACVSDSHAWHLAWLIDQLDPQAPTSLIGYSYGSRLIGGCLHLLGGGRLAGHALMGRVHPDRLPVRVVLMAGALDSHSLVPNGRNGRAMTQVERMLVMINPLDPVLFHYPHLGGLFHKGPPALGLTGLSLASLGHERDKVSLWNVSRYVGSEHDWRRYIYSPRVVSALREYALFAE